MLILPSSRSRKRLDIPHEPGQWIEIQRLAWSEIPKGSMSVDAIAYIHAVFAAAIVAWSYDADVSSETVKWIDYKTANWLFVEIDRFVHHGDYDQGNATAPSV